MARARPANNSSKKLRERDICVHVDLLDGREKLRWQKAAAADYRPLGNFIRRCVNVTIGHDHMSLPVVRRLVVTARQLDERSMELASQGISGCAYCKMFQELTGEPVTECSERDLEWDHVAPLRPKDPGHRGRNEPANLVRACGTLQSIQKQPLARAVERDAYGTRQTVARWGLTPMAKKRVNPTLRLRVGFTSEAEKASWVDAAAARYQNLNDFIRICVNAQVRLGRRGRYVRQ